MRNDIPLIAESVEELSRIVASTRRKRMKQRLQALLLIQSGECTTREAVSTALGIHRHTVSRWLTKYDEGGLSELLEIRTHPNRKRVLDDGIYEDLAEKLKADLEDFSTYRDVQEWLKRKHGVDVKYKTLYRLVRYELGIDLTSASAEESTSGKIRCDRAPIPLSRDGSESGNRPDSPAVPSVAGYFRSVARLIEDGNAGKNDVADAARAAGTLLEACVVVVARHSAAEMLVVKAGLANSDVQIVSAGTSTEIRACARWTLVDLIIIADVSKSGAGLTLVRELRDDPAFDNVPIVAVATTEEDGSDAAQRFGADACLRTPITGEQVASTVLRLLVASHTAIRRKGDRGALRSSGPGRSVADSIPNDR